MYYLYTGSKLGTCLVAHTGMSGGLDYFLASIIISNIPDFKEGVTRSCSVHNFSELKTTSIYVALKEYEKESKRIRNMRLSHSQYKDD